MRGSQDRAQRKKDKKDQAHRDRDRNRSKQRYDRENHRGYQQNKAYRQSRDQRDQREERDQRYPRDNRDGNRDNRDNRDNRGRDQRDNRDNRDNRDGGRRDRRFEKRQQKDPYFQKRRQIQLVRKSDPAKAEELQHQLQKQIILDQKERQIEQARQKFKQAQKEMEQAKRQDHTILVYCLPLKAKQKHIWTYFSQANCGKIRDIRIIRDARSHRSKGVAYVQFYNSQAVQKALQIGDKPFQLKGRFFYGLKVQHSQAQKNRAAAAARQMRVIKPAQPLQQQQEIIRRQTKVFVGGLVEKLSQITEKDLKDLFEPFGQIQYVDIHRDPQTGICKGFAYIQYVDPQKAKLAVKNLNGLKIGTQKLAVSIMNVQQRGDITASQEFIYNTGNRMRLMNQLSGATSGPSFANLMKPSISTVNTPYLIMTSMFKMQGTSPAFFQDMKKQIQTRAQEFGVVERVFIEKNNQGNIWIKFADTASAVKCQQNLNGKYFDNKKIFMYFVTQNTYQTRVGI